MMRGTRRWIRLWLTPEEYVRLEEAAAGDVHEWIVELIENGLIARTGKGFQQP